jgi:hypothetical protein
LEGIPCGWWIGMRVEAALLCSLGLLIVSARGDDSVRHTNPVCWKEPRIYHPGGAQAAELESAAKRILQLGHLTAQLGEPHTLSPNRAYAFHYSEQPNPGPPSGSTRVSLVIFKEKSYLLSVRADAAFSLQDPRWVNEKLISFRLWLGRLGGVDVLVDVEQESVVRMEAFADGRILWEQARASCKAVPHVAECDETCTSLE